MTCTEVCCCSYSACPCLFLWVSGVSQGAPSGWASWGPFPYMKRRAHKCQKNSSTHCVDFYNPANQPQPSVQNPELSWESSGPLVEAHKHGSHPLPWPSRPFYNLFPAISNPPFLLLPPCSQPDHLLAFPSRLHYKLFPLPKIHLPHPLCLLDACSFFISECRRHHLWVTPNIDWIYCPYHVPISMLYLSLPWHFPHCWAVG